MEPGGLKVLMVSRDRALFEPGSAVAERLKEQAKLVEELHVVVLAPDALRLKPTTLAPNLWLYPTNSSSKFFYASGAARLGKRIIVDRQFVRGRSVVTTQDPYECGSAGLSAAKRWRLPLEVQVHADDVLAPYFPGLLHKIRNAMAVRVLRQAQSIRAVHEFMKRELVEKFGIPAARVSVLPVYIDAEAVEKKRVTFDLHTRYGYRFVMLMVARLVPQKNIPMALEVLAKLHAVHPDAGLIIAGTGPDEAALKKRAEELHVSANVVFAGFQEDLGSFYKTADVFLQTSLFEGYGMALVEAALSNLPVVSTPVGIALDLKSGEEALICPQGDVDFMFKAVYDLLENNAMRETLKRRGREAVRAKLLPKEAYLNALRTAWEHTASEVHES